VLGVRKRGVYPAVKLQCRDVTFEVMELQPNAAAARWPRLGLIFGAIAKPRRAGL